MVGKEIDHYEYDAMFNRAEQKHVVTVIFDADVGVDLSHRLEVGKIRRADDDHLQRHDDVSDNCDRR